MTLAKLKALLRAHPNTLPTLILPNDKRVPAHFHITEVGHVTRRFIDCGGKVHPSVETCLLQTWVADDVDHRLTSETFAEILDLGGKILPSDELEVEVEYEDHNISQYPIDTAYVVGGKIELRLGAKHTDCLAREKCGIESGRATAVSCC